MSNLENFNLEDFVLHYNYILCFCNPRNIYHKNTESHESTKILTLEIFRLYGTCNVGSLSSQLYNVLFKNDASALKECIYIGSDAF